MVVTLLLLFIFAIDRSDRCEPGVQATLCRAERGADRQLEELVTARAGSTQRRNLFIGHAISIAADLLKVVINLTTQRLTAGPRLAMCWRDDAWSSEHALLQSIEAAAPRFPSHAEDSFAPLIQASTA